MTLQAIERGPKKPALPEAQTLELTWPWWMNPIWPLVLLTGSMAMFSMSVSEETYAEVWGVRKFLTADNSQLLFICMMVTLLGIIFSLGMKARGGIVAINIVPTQIVYLQKTYKFLLFLTVFGYLAFFGFAFAQGLSFADLAAVVQRDDAAVYRVKARLETIPGVTTMTQFGPIAAVLGFLLRRLGHAGRGYMVVVLLSLLRVVFYTERLALREVLVPLVLVAAVTVRRNSKASKLVSLAPAIIVPLVWAVFAMSEYLRSWITYQYTTDVSFVEWVSLRLFGYYTTSFNNSALFMTAHEGTYALPFYSVSVVWNAPLISSVMQHPGIGGMEAYKWWPKTLANYSSPEFNNQGSFLTAYAELGPFMGLAFWLGVGLMLGAMFAKMTKGSLPAMLAYSILFIGLLELPRLIYWTEGRAFPGIVAVIFIAMTYPRPAQSKPAISTTSVSPAYARLAVGNDLPLRAHGR